MNKNVLHITFQQHPFLIDLSELEYSWKFINDVDDINYLNNFDVIILHFIKWKDLSFLNKINKWIQIWLFLHDYSLICDKSTLLFDNNIKCWIDNYNKCNCTYINDNRISYDKFLLNTNLLFKKLNFVIVFDNYWYKKLLNYSNKYGFKLKMIKHWLKLDNIYSNKVISNNLKLWFCWNFKEHKWKKVLLKLLDKLPENFLLNNNIEFNFYILWDKIDFSMHNVNFYSNIDRKNIYKNIDCLLIPSIWNETWPMTLYEAFANKIPVIISDQEWLKEKILDRIDSYVFKTWNERDLLKWILWMKKNYNKVILNNEWFKYNSIENFNKELINFLNDWK